MDWIQCVPVRESTEPYGIENGCLPDFGPCLQFRDLEMEPWPD